MARRRTANPSRPSGSGRGRRAAEHPHAHPHEQALRRRRRRRRRRVLALLSVVLLPLLALVVLTRPPVLARFAASALDDLLGGEVTVARARWLGGGRLLLEDVRLRVPGLDGEAGEAAFVDLAEVRLDPAQLRRFSIRPLRVRLESARLRVSADRTEIGRYNLGGLDPGWLHRSSQDAPPEIELRAFRIEVGDHGPEGWRLQGTRTISGGMRQERPGSDWYEVSVFEDLFARERGDDRAPLRIDGGWNVRTNAYDARITGLVFNESLRDLCPSFLREWWDELELDGAIESVHAAWGPERDFEASFGISGVGLTLPGIAPGFWVRLQEGEIVAADVRPRMIVERGEVRFTPDRLVLESIEGVVGGGEPGIAAVPWRVDLDVQEVPALSWDARGSWMNDVRDAAAFRMTVEASDVVVGPGSAGGPADAIDLPDAVARAIEPFHLEAWTLDTTFTVERAAPVNRPDGTLAPGPLRTEGRATIGDARGRFQPFPYPLRDIDAELAFDRNEVRIERFEGRGSGGSRVALEGTVGTPWNLPRIRLDLVADGVPVDEDLLGALPDDRRAFVGQLRHEPSHRLLVERGLAPDRPLGGQVDLDLDLDRVGGAEGSTVITGTITAHDLDLLPRRFPFPLRIESGTLRWTPTAFILDDEVRLSGPGGVTGRLGGRVEVARRVGGGEPSGATRAVPWLDVSLNGLRVGPALLAALPPEDASLLDDPQAVLVGRSRLARRIASIGLRGELDATATIAPLTIDDAPGDEAAADGDEGRIDAVVEVALRDVACDLGPEVARLLELEARPPRLPLANGRGVVRLERGRFSLDGIEGDLAGGRLRLDGTTADARGGLRARLDEVDLSGPLGDVARAALRRLDRERDARPERGAEAAAVADAAPTREREPEGDRAAPPPSLTDAWERLRPEGTIDAEVRWIAADEDRFELALAPRRLALALESGVVELAGPPPTVDGLVHRAVIDGEGVRFEELDLTVTDPDGQSSQLWVDGSIAGGTFDLDARWGGGRVRSPLLAELLVRVGALEQLQRMRDLEAEGLFEATLALDGTADDADYELVLKPEQLAIVLDGVPIHVRMNEGSRAVLRPGRIDLERLSGHNGQRRFDVSGVVFTEGPVRAELDLDVVGRFTGPQLSAFLPERLRRTLADLELAEGRDSRLDRARLVAERRGDAWAIDLTGRIVLDDARLTAGIDFESLRGPVDITLRRAPDDDSWLRLEAGPMSARILGQPLERVTAVIVRDGDDRPVRVERLRGRAGGGVMSGEAVIDPSAGGRWTASLRLVEMPLADFAFGAADADADADEDEEADPAVARGPGRPRHEISGDLHASIDLEGVIGEPGSRIGRGRAHAVNGDLVAIPALFRVAQLLQAPFVGGRFDYGEATFFIAGDIMHIERFELESTSRGVVNHEISGRGAVDLSAMTIDARVAARSGMAGIRDLIGSLGDALAAIRLVGPLADPEPVIVPLPGRDRSGERSPAAPRLAEEGQGSVRTAVAAEPPVVSAADPDGGG